MKTWKEFKNYNYERNFLNLSTHTQILILFNLIIFIAHIHLLTYSVTHLF
jgi:hypothetical protein